MINEEGFFRIGFTYKREHQLLTNIFSMQSKQNTSIKGIQGSILLLTVLFQMFENIKPSISLLCKVSNSQKDSHISTVYS